MDSSESGVYDSSPDSVRRAMSELYHKSGLVKEERDYYTALFSTSHQAYTDHRRELEYLLEKERSAHAQRESDLQAELADIVARNSQLSSQVEARRAKAVVTLQHSIDEFHRESADTEQRLRLEIERVHSQLLDERRRVADARSEASELVTACTDRRTRQDSLKVRVQKLTEERQMRSTMAPAPAPPLPPPVPPRSARSESPGRRKVPVPFIPSGSGAHLVTAETATHNVHALAQSVKKANIRSPPRLRAQDITNDSASGPSSLHHGVLGGYDESQLRAMRQSLEAELEEMRAEYDSIAHTLGDPRYASTGVNRRLRELFEAIDDKTQQLDAVTVAHNRLDAAFRLSRMMEESGRRNGECSALHASILDVVHSKSL